MLKNEESGLTFVKNKMKLKSEFNVLGNFI